MNRDTKFRGWLKVEFLHTTFIKVYKNINNEDKINHYGSKSMGKWMGEFYTIFKAAKA